MKRYFITINTGIPLIFIYIHIVIQSYMISSNQALAIQENWEATERVIRDIHRQIKLELNSCASEW